MTRVGVLLGLSVLSAFVPGVPVGMVVSMIIACVAGFGAVRFHGAADYLTVVGDTTARSTRQIARFCDDLAIALCFLALLYGIHPV